MDRAARDCVAGDTLVEPISGTLCKVLEMGPETGNGMVTMQVEGLGSGAKSWLSLKSARLMRCYSRGQATGRAAEDRAGR